MVLPVRAAHRMMKRISGRTVSDGDDDVARELASIPG
jgi:hypothetical protein